MHRFPVPSPPPMYVICQGCAVASVRAKIDKGVLAQLGRGKSKAEVELIEFQLIMREHVPCAFCRTDRASNNRELVQRLRNRIDKYNDANAMNQLGDYYIDGRRGLEQDRSKAMDLYLRSYEQGSPEAADRLSYYSGSFWNRGEKMKYLKEGARLGNTNLCIELGVMGTQTGIIDVEESLKLIMTAAKAGDDGAMGFCWKFFRSGHLKKQDLETTMRAKQAALDEVNNEDRDFAKRFGAFRAKLDSRYN